MNRNVRRNRPPLLQETTVMPDAPSPPASLPDAAEVLRLGAREAARQAALLRMPGAGQPVTDPQPAVAGRAA